MECTCWDGIRTTKRACLIHDYDQIEELKAKVRDLEAQLAQARDAALEEAAREAEQTRNRLGAQGIAAVIRALKTTAFTSYNQDENRDFMTTPSTVEGDSKLGTNSEPGPRLYTLAEIDKAVEAAMEKWSHFPGLDWLKNFRASLEGVKP
jgi:hypothetical protein